MALRSGHGTGAGVPRVEVMPADELPSGMPADADADSRTATAEGGRFTRGNRRSVLGGRAKRGKSRLTARLGLASLPDGTAFAPYRRAAATFRRVQCSELAKTVGGGVCGPGPSSVVASAALALACRATFPTGPPRRAILSSRCARPVLARRRANIFLPPTSFAPARPKPDPRPPLTRWRAGRAPRT